MLLHKLTTASHCMPLRNNCSAARLGSEVILKLLGEGKHHYVVLHHYIPVVYSCIRTVKLYKLLGTIRSPIYTTVLITGTPSMFYAVATMVPYRYSYVQTTASTLL